MATSSIFNDIVITSEKDAKRVCDAYDAFQKNERQKNASSAQPYISQPLSSFAHINKALKSLEKYSK